VRRLTAAANSVQFSEGGKEEPTFTVAQVAAILKETLPKSMQFSEDEPEGKAVEHPEVGTFFARDGLQFAEKNGISAEDAKKQTDELAKRFPGLLKQSA
jgi:hypothetical protein